MMLNRILVCVVVSAVIVIATAVSPANEPPRERRAFVQALNKIKQGMPEAEVIAIVGRPDDVGSKKEGNLGDTLKIWRYGTSGHKQPVTLGQIWIDVDHRVQLIAGQGTPPPEGLFTEAELRPIFEALLELPGVDAGRYNPRPVIRAVNLLQPLGKEKVLAAIEDFLRVFPFEIADYRAHNAREGVFVVLRTLFEVPTGPTVFPYDVKSPGGTMPPIWVGDGSPGPDDERLLPRYPVAIEGDIPFCFSEVSFLSGPPEPPELHVSYFRKFGTLRAKPLSPTARPVEALLAFEESPRWYFKRIRHPFYTDQRERLVVGNQVMSLLDTVYQVTPNCDGNALGYQFDEQSQKILNHASMLAIRWDAKESKYTLQGGASLVPLPRYQFQVGQEFVYSYRDENLDESRSRHGGPIKKSRSLGTTQWRIWVLDKNADGSVRLLIDRDTREVAANKHVEGSARVLHEFNIFPDGRLVARRATGDHLEDPNYPTPLFIALPADRSALAAEWRSPTNVGSTPPIGQVEPPGSRTFRCLIDSRRTAPGGTLAIHCLQRLPGDCVQGLTRTRVCSFDVAAGRLTGFTEETTDNFGFSGHSHCGATVKLVSVSQMSGKFLPILKEEADAFFRMQAQYDTMADTFSENQSIAECTERLAKVRNALTLAGQSATMEQIQVQYAALLKRFDGDAERALRNAKGREELLRAAPADWALSDFDGKPHRLRDYRGRVVVLDFWYKGCGWCIKAMPEIKELAEAYKSKGVAVLGMNVDEEDEDALSVIRREQITYTTLKARPVEKIYRMSDFGCPFFIVLDQSGRVRHVEIGYSKYLARRLGVVIDRLASETPTAK